MDHPDAGNYGPSGPNLVERLVSRPAILVLSCQIITLAWSRSQDYIGHGLLDLVRPYALPLQCF